MPKVAISLGSNLGDRLANLRFAIERLSRSFSLTGLSSLYLTAPVGGPAQDDFLNAVEAGKSPRPDFGDGLRNQRVLDAIEKSSNSGQWIKIHGD